jgi:hypothetical protein
MIPVKYWLTGVFLLAALMIFADLLHRFLVWFWNKAHRAGWNEGFKDAHEFSKLWWDVAENDVLEARKKIWQAEPKKGQWP